MAGESKSSGSGVSMDVEDVESGLYKFREATQEAVREYLQDQCFELVDYMQQNRPWTDRTGLARRSLSADVQEKNVAGGNTSFRVKLESPVEYGSFLEFGVRGHSRPYPIIEPTLRLKAPEVVNGLKGLLESMKVKSKVKRKLRHTVKPKAAPKK